MQRRFLAFDSAPETLRHETLWGAQHLVVPVVAMVEGVRHAANAEHPELVPADALAATVEAWNGRPATFAHPKRDGAFVSAGSPDVFEHDMLGFYFHAAMRNASLVGEVWINLDRVAAIGTTAEALVTALEAGEHVEISGGYYCDTDETEGVFGGRAFSGVQSNIVPDHFAIGVAEGACNWQDGCGAPRVNCGIGGCASCPRKDGEMAGKRATETESFMARAMRVFAGRHGGDVALCRFWETSPEGLRENVNGVGHRALEESLGAALNKAHPASEWLYVSDVFEEDSIVVYVLDGKTYQRSYTADTLGVVTLGMDAAEVVMSVSYQPVGSPPPANQPTPSAQEAKVNETTKERVAALIANEETPYNDASAEWLGSLTEEQLGAVEKHVAARTETPAAPAVAAAPVVPVTPVTATVSEPAITPAERAILNRALAAEKARVDGLVGQVKGHAVASKLYTAEQLAAMTAEDLERIVTLAGIGVPAPRYDGRGGPRESASDTVEAAPSLIQSMQAKAAAAN